MAFLWNPWNVLTRMPLEEKLHDLHEVLHQYSQRTCKLQIKFPTHACNWHLYLCIRIVENFRDMSWCSIGHNFLYTLLYQYWYRNDGMLFTFPIYGAGDTVCQVDFLHTGQVVMYMPIILPISCMGKIDHIHEQWLLHS